MSLTAIFLLAAFIVFVVAAVINTPTWNRLIASGLALLTLGMGALSVIGMG